MIENIKDLRREYTLPQVLEYPEYVNDPTKPFEMVLSRQNDSSSPNFDYFSNTDSRTAFETNLKIMPEDWHYRYKKLRYFFNSNNFRTYEWKDIDWKNAIVLYGCSNTFGVGVAEDETLDKQLEKLTNKQVVNLGVPGGSNELIMYIAGMTIEKFEAPCAVVVNWSSTDRFTYYTDQKEYHAGAWDLQDPKKDERLKNTQRLYIQRNLNPYNEVMHTWYHAKTTKALFKNRSRFISVTNFGHVSQYADVDELFLVDNNARDRLHPGPNVFKNMAEYIEKFL